jgi:hypothetical protein
MRILAGALWGLLLSGGAFANALTTDYTDLWWNDNEPGWGVNLSQQNDTIVATIFIYDGRNDPYWLIAPNTVLKSDGTFAGPLYQTRGPYYLDAPFNPAAVTTLQVGNFSFAPSSFAKASLTYNIGGRVITKTIARQSWRSDNLTGHYIGSRQGSWSGCSPALDGKVDSPAIVGVTHSGNNVIISDTGNGYSCTYQGQTQPRGRFTEIIGTGICDDQVVRELDATEVFVSREAFTMRYTLHLTGTDCDFTGYTGGIREIQ